MCVMSMVMDHFSDKWRQIQPIQPISPLNPFAIPQISPAEIEEFRKLLDRAREYDKRHGQPDCELDEKRKEVKRLAEQLGVEIDFV